MQKISLPHKANEKHHEHILPRSVLRFVQVDRCRYSFIDLPRSDLDAIWSIFSGYCFGKHCDSASETPIPTETPTQAVTPIPSPTQLEEPLPTPIIEIPSEPEVCAAVSRSQLQTGMKVIIQRRLNFRSSPGIMNNWMLTNLPGTQVEVIGGPACTRYQNGGAYLWWQIKLPNGLTGWSAEASAFGSFYFMEPVK